MAGAAVINRRSFSPPEQEAVIEGLASRNCIEKTPISPTFRLVSLRRSALVTVIYPYVAWQITFSRLAAELLVAGGAR